jgi:tetratricopeptide (TPR) repeat protein
VPPQKPDIPPPDNGEPTLRKEEEVGRLRARRRKIIGALVLLAIALAGVSAAGLFGKWRTRQAKQMAHSAAELFAAGRQREAMLRMQTAWGMRPDEPQVMRALAGIFDASGDPRSLPIHAKLVATAEASKEDRQRCVLAALRHGQYEFAANEARILAASGDEGYAHAVRAAQSRARGDFATAESAMRAVTEESGAYDTTRLQLASLLSSRSGNAEEAREEAFAILEGLSSRPDATGLEALASGLSRRVVPPEKAAEWTARLEKHPLANDRSFLVVQSERWPADEAGRRDIVNLVMARFAGAPVERKVPAMLWLNEHAEFARTLELMPESKARANADAFVLWMDAAAGRGDWTAIDAALEKKNPLTGGLADLFRARAAQKTGRTGTAQQGYERAIQAALDDPAQMPALLGFMEADGQKALLVDALVSALSDPAKARAARDALLGVSGESRDAAELRDAWSAIRDAEPGNREAANAADYYGLVAGTASPTEVAARGLAAEGDTDTRTVRALALLKQGKSNEAAAVFRGLSLRSDTITPRQKAAVVCVLAAKGEPDQAELMGATLDASLLTKQEVAMVEKYLGR